MTIVILLKYFKALCRAPILDLNPRTKNTGSLNLHLIT